MTYKLPENFISLLHKELQRYGGKQSELARKLEVNPVDLHRYLTGKVKRVQADMWIKLCKHFPELKKYNDADITAGLTVSTNTQEADRIFTENLMLKEQLAMKDEIIKMKDELIKSKNALIKSYQDEQGNVAANARDVS